jgi:aminoglycoside phosphotransferase (APT) family kinase protein
VTWHDRLVSDLDLASLTPLTGGWSGQTFLADVAGERSVVRIYANPSPRGDAAHEVDAALLELVRGLVPVPEVLEVRRADPGTGAPALLITSYVDGVRGDELLPTLDDDGLARLGTHLGELLAVLGGMPMLRGGPFVDGDLRIGTFGDVDDLLGYVAGSQLPWFSPDDRAGLLEVAAAAQEKLDGVGRCCLVHSDFNPKNLILDPDTLHVRALVDWEFAHAGNPYADLGNLLRFERRPAFADAVLTTYAARRWEDTRWALELARAADLWALVELAGRKGQNPVADRAHALLLRIARTGDLDAVPDPPKR